MIYLNGRPTIGFGEAPTTARRPPPPIELRTAYTAKGIGIGAGGLVGYLVAEPFGFGPLGLVLCGFTGWYIGNQIAIKAERDFTGG
jgi:hypothetical protein